MLSSEDMENSWKHLALEAIVTLAETAAPMMRKEAGHYIPVLIPLVLNLMTDLEEDPEWSVSDEIIEDDSDRYFLTTLGLYANPIYKVLSILITIYYEADARSS